MLSSNVGCAIHSLPWRDRRTAPIGPSNGMPDTVSAADAPLIDSTSCGLHEVGTHDGGDDLHLVAEALGEARAQRTVGETAGEDGRLAGTTLTTEDAAGDLARRVHALLDVDRQREEVDALAGLRRDDGAQDGGVTDADEHRAVGLGSELARLQGHFESGRIDGAG